METSDPVPLVSYIAQINISNADLYLSIGLGITIIILLIISALITGAEIAFFGLKSEQVKEFEKKTDFKSTHIIAQLNNPKKFIATITISSVFIKICFIVLSAILLNELFDFSKFANYGFLIQLGIIAFALIIFSEFIPKRSARNKPKKFARAAIVPVSIFSKLLHPFTLLMVKTSSIAERKLVQIKQNITIDDLSEALNLTTDQITEDENILKGIVKFGNISAKEIMRSRVDVIAIDYESKFKELLEFIIESGHSRIPVYSESLDNIKGVLFIKDLLPHIDQGDDFKWQSLLRQSYFVPENKKINDLLKEFQENKIHMAIVIDEYGGTSGIVTLEDVIEEIVGEITDESDEDDEIIFSQINNSTYLFEGKTLLNDFLKIVDIDDDYFDNLSGDADTIAGVILELTGEIPSKNTKVEYKNLTFTIESVDKRRIKQIKVTIKE